MIGAWVSNHVIRSDVYNLPFIIWSPLDKVIAISQTIFFKCIFENAKFCILMSSMTVSGIHLRAISYKVVKISLTCLLNYYFKIAVAYPGKQRVWHCAKSTRFDHDVLLISVSGYSCILAFWSVKGISQRVHLQSSVCIALQSSRGR